jgi:hypothetical protein
VDDGVFIGASMSRISHGFKKVPYKTKQSFSGEIALKTGSFQFKYRGDFTDVIGKLDLNVTANIFAPNFKQNFYGYGNETQQLFAPEDYRLRLNQILIYPALEVGDEDKVRFLFGPIYQQARVSPDTIDKFSVVFPDLTPDAISRKHYAGLNTQFTYDPYALDTLPVFQVRFLVNLGYLKQLEDNTVNVGFVRGYVSLFYYIYDKKGTRLTLATRFGGGINNGDYEFYQANIIGGRTNENVRGFRGERILGHHLFVQQLRSKVKAVSFQCLFLSRRFWHHRVDR